MMHTHNLALFALALSLAACGDSDAPNDASADALDAAPADAPRNDASPIDAAADGPPGDASAAPVVCAPLLGAATLETGFARGLWSTSITDNLMTNLVALSANAGAVWSAALVGMSGTVTGAPVTVPEGQSAVVVTRFSTAGAMPRAQTISASGAAPTALRLSARADGVTVYVSSAGALRVGAMALAPTAGTSALWTIRLDAAGTFVSASSLALPPGATPERLQPTADGGYLTTIRTPGPATIDGAAFDCDYVILRAGPDGRPRWKRCIAPVRDTVPDVHGLSEGPDGTVYVAGFPIRNPDFGFGADPFDASAGGSFVLSLDATGRSRWVRHVQRMYASVLAVADGALLFGSHLAELPAFPYRFADRPLTPCGRQSRSFVARLDARGEPQWFRDLGTSQAQVTGLTSSGDLLVTLTTNSSLGPLALGAAEFPANTVTAVARLSADGRVLRAQSITGTSLAPMSTPVAQFAALAPDVDGHVVGLLQVSAGTFSLGPRGALTSGPFGSLALVGIDL